MSKPTPLMIDDRERQASLVARSTVTERQPPQFPEHIKSAISRRNGAKYYRCALQVNTPLQDNFKGFESRHRRNSAGYQRDYALALATACKKAGIDAVGICDHNSLAYVETIRHELGQENIIVFPGFEIASTEGIHLLCLFNPGAKIDDLHHLLTALGLPPKDRWMKDEGIVPHQSRLRVPEIIEFVQRNREGICIAAHVERENGLLNECAKTTRAQYFIDPNLFAVQISGRREELPEFFRKVLDNELTHYHRQQPVAVLNCLDVYNLKDLSKPECSTWIKMSSPSLEGLWQAFLDPTSRLRLLSEAEPHSHAELAAVTWQGNFLDGSAICFNENLNCLIGGRGSGKSTIIESLRYVLDLQPIGEAAQRTQEEILQQVLREDTRISLLVRSHRPAPRYYLIERRYLQSPLVYDENGEVLPIHPTAILPEVEIFGQHEIAEIAQDRAKQHQLLQRFRDVERAEEYDDKKRDLLKALKLNRQEFLETQRESETLAEKLSRLPAIEENLRRYKELGIEAKLKAQANFTREEALLKNSREGFPLIKKALEQLRRTVTQNAGKFDSSAFAELPNADLWIRLEKTLADFHEKMQEHLDGAGASLNDTGVALLEIAETWQIRRQADERGARELKTTDGEMFIKLRREYETLAPLKKEARRLKQHEDDLKEQRAQLLQNWEELKWQLFELDQAAAAKISQDLEGRVSARVAKEGNLTPLLDFLQEHYDKKLRDGVAGKLDEEHPIAMSDFVQHLRDGKKTLQEFYAFTDRQAEKLAQLPPEKMLELEELDLPVAIHFELNVAEKNKTPQWKPIHALSIGQKATTILLVLLLDSETPLVIDQPEDDLDNRFIADTIIPTLRREKRKRQFIFATHNANLPVLGDAELIVALEPSGGESPSEIKDDHLGAIDTASVKLLVEQILEGGQQAFETRRAKYGF